MNATYRLAARRPAAHRRRRCGLRPDPDLLEPPELLRQAAASARPRPEPGPAVRTGVGRSTRRRA